MASRLLTAMAGVFFGMTCGIAAASHTADHRLEELRTPPEIPVYTGQVTDPAYVVTEANWRFVSSPATKVVYTFEDMPGQSWVFRGSVVRGHVPRGSTFGDSVAFKDGVLVVLDAGDWESELMATYYKSVGRGFRKLMTAHAETLDQIRCMGGADAESWVRSFILDKHCGLTWNTSSQAFRNTIEHH